MLWTFRQRLAAARAAYRNPKLAIPYYVGKDAAPEIPCTSYGCQLPGGHAGHHGLWYQWEKYTGGWERVYRKVAVTDFDR